MDIKELKNYLYDNTDKLQTVLEECGFGHIKKHSGTDDNYFTMSNVDGNNKQAITVYITPSLLTINYTRDICENKNSCDVIDLICFARQENFFDTLRWIAEKSGIDYYHRFDDEIPESLRILKQLKELMSRVNDKTDDDDIPLIPRNINILKYYFPYVNDMFYEDGISYGTQVEFQIGLDPRTGRITIPIFDEVGSLIGIKGRFWDREVPEDRLKYYYIEPCPKSRILYGYHQSKNYIKDDEYILIGESEKSFLQMWSMNHKNAVATGGTKISRHQIEKLSRLGKKIIFCFDKDFNKEKIQLLRNKFLPQIDFWAMIDEDNILNEKESPSDDKYKFEHLLKNNVYKINKTED